MATLGIGPKALKLECLKQAAIVHNSDPWVSSVTQGDKVDRVMKTAKRMRDWINEDEGEDDDAG